MDRRLVLLVFEIVSVVVFWFCGFVVLFGPHPPSSLSLGLKVNITDVAARKGWLLWGDLVSIGMGLGQARHFLFSFVFTCSVLYEMKKKTMNLYMTDPRFMNVQTT